MQGFVNESIAIIYESCFYHLEASVNLLFKSTDRLFRFLEYFY